MTYLITFTCYGSHLHGDERGSIDREHNIYGGRMITPNTERLGRASRRMDQPPYTMDPICRQTVLNALRHRCLARDWTLLAAQVRTNHVHLVVEAQPSPERVMNDLKSFASASLNRCGIDHPTRKRWARHGSTRWLWNQDDVTAAIHYVVRGQGEPMAVYDRAATDTSTSHPSAPHPFTSNTSTSQHPRPTEPRPQGATPPNPITK